MQLQYFVVIENICDNRSFNLIIVKMKKKNNYLTGHYRMSLSQTLFQSRTAHNMLRQYV